MLYLPEPYNQPMLKKIVAYNKDKQQNPIKNINCGRRQSERDLDGITSHQDPREEKTGNKS